MKISLEWLSEYIQIDKTVEEIADLLSNLGFPIESIDSFGDDTVIDVEVTSNRGDCLSHIGIARELAAATGQSVRYPQVQLDESEESVDPYLSVTIKEPSLCGRYTGRVIQGVKVGPSPDWMVRRLEAVGLRSVNNVVDATNYAMMEHGQPPHAFDYDKIGGKAIIVRKGRAGENLVSIDGTKCQLTEDMLVIADASQPVAIAGVMGGLDSEVSDQTTTILLEEASFDPVSIRSTARRLVLNSEASFRFERQVDMENIDWASRRCAQLIVQVAGGTVVKGVADAYPAKPEPQRVQMRLSRMNHLLGIEIPTPKVMEIFSGLGFEPEEKGDVIECTQPTWRHDLSRQADLIEEVARCFGYDRIPVEPKIHIEVTPPDVRQQTAAKIRTFLNGCGYFETINVTFVDDDTAGRFTECGPQGHLAVGDVSRKSANLLRQDLIGSLIGVLQTNVHAGNSPCRIYEIADTFLPTPEEHALPVQRTKVSLAAECDFQQLRGVVEELLGRMHPEPKIRFLPCSLPWAQAAAVINLQDEKIGVAGILKKELADKYDLDKQTVCAAELDLLSLMQYADVLPTARPLPKFPAVVRDLSLLVGEPVRWADIEKAIAGAAPAELEQIRFAGLYRGKPIPKGKKSLTVSLCFRDEDGTLRHEQVDAFEAPILAKLQADLGAERRTG